jgi:GTPase involved in cell partitioning and DNA repair
MQAELETAAGEDVIQNAATATSGEAAGASEVKDEVKEKLKDKNGTDTTPTLGQVKGILKMGMIGVPNVGKSSTFNFFSKYAAKKIKTQGYQVVRSQDFNQAYLKVQDKKYDELIQFFKPQNLEIP